MTSGGSSVVIGTALKGELCFFCGHGTRVVTILEFQTNDMIGVETARRWAVWALLRESTADISVPILKKMSIETSCSTQNQYVSKNLWPHHIKEECCDSVTIQSITGLSVFLWLSTNLMKRPKPTMNWFYGMILTLVTSVSHTLEFIWTQSYINHLVSKHQLTVYYYIVENSPQQMQT